MPSDAPWPAVLYEARPWTPTLAPDLLSRSAREAHRGPYRAAVPPLIADLAPSLPSALVARVVEASADIARFDSDMGGEIAPFASVLLRSESASSSRIENLTSGSRAIAMAELGEGGARNATEIVGNVAAMTAALELAEDLSPQAVLAMHHALLSQVEPTIAGRWREEPVWIGGTSFGPHLAAFVPPHHERLGELMHDVMAFARRTDLPPLVQAALAHAQFETVHPFADGNGRTGRALIHAVLRARGLTRQVTVPVSAGLLVDTEAYFATLTAYREGDPFAVVSELAAAADRALVNGRQLVGDLRLMRARWDEALRVRRGAAAWRVADLALRQPVLDSAAVARALSIAPSNALRAIDPLVEAGILTEFSGRRRHRLWQASEVLTALDAFAARAGRRA